MNLQCCSKGDSLYLYLSGELDEYSVSRLRGETDRIIDDHAGFSRAIFNLTNVRFMDSTGIGFLIGRYNRLKKYGILMFLENPDYNADKILTLSGVYSLIPKV